MDQDSLQNTKMTLLMNSLNSFYVDSKYIDEIKNIVDQNNMISLRILDWFITNYSKKITTLLKDNFNVYLNYRLMLKSYGKHNFDPFCRRNKMVFYYTSDKYLETSCGQLCFFRWCFENGILDYVKKNLAIIEKDMKTSLKEKNIGQNRKPLSISASRSINKQKMEYIVIF